MTYKSQSALETTSKTRDRGNERESKREGEMEKEKEKEKGRDSCWRQSVGEWESVKEGTAIAWLISVNFSAK